MKEIRRYWPDAKELIDLEDMAAECVDLDLRKPGSRSGLHTYLVSMRQIIDRILVDVYADYRDCDYDGT